MLPFENWSEKCLRVRYSLSLFTLASVLPSVARLAAQCYSLFSKRIVNFFNVFLHCILIKFAVCFNHFYFNKKYEIQKSNSLFKVWGAPVSYKYANENSNALIISSIFSNVSILITIIIFRILLALSKEKSSIHRGSWKKNVIGVSYK